MSGAVPRLLFNCRGMWRLMPRGSAGPSGRSSSSSFPFAVVARPASTCGASRRARRRRGLGITDGSFQLRFLAPIIAVLLFLRLQVLREIGAGRGPSLAERRTDGSDLLPAPH